MQPQAQVQAAIELLAQSIATRRPADRLMANYFRSRRYIGSKDKREISEWFYQALRRRRLLSYLLAQLSLSETAELLIAVLIKLNGGNIADVFSGRKHHPDRLSGAELQALESLPADAESKAPEAIQLNVPEWLEPKLQTSLGDNYREEMLAGLQRAKTHIRCNTLQTDQATLLANFQEQDFNVTAGRFSPWALTFDGRVALFELSLFKTGQFEVQDEGSQLLSLLTQAKAGQKVVDFCAGAGGKTLAMAAMMQNKGSLFACDVHSKRLEELQKRAKRAGVHNVRTQLLTSERDKWVKHHQGIADTVLIDAPCSGTGTWRRSPDSRWNLTHEQLQDLQALQASILDSAARLVKPGGKMFYATCSLLREENEAQIERFLADHSQFERGELELPLGVESQQGGSELRLLSSQHGCDGFFAAALRRRR